MKLPKDPKSIQIMSEPHTPEQVAEMKRALQILGLRSVVVGAAKNWRHGGSQEILVQAIDALEEYEDKNPPPAASAAKAG